MRLSSNASSATHIETRSNFVACASRHCSPFVSAIVSFRSLILAACDSCRVLVAEPSLLLVPVCAFAASVALRGATTASRYRWIQRRFEMISTIQEGMDAFRQIQTGTRVSSPRRSPAAHCIQRRAGGRAPTSQVLAERSNGTPLQMQSPHCRPLPVH